LKGSTKLGKKGERKKLKAKGRKLKAIKKSRNLKKRFAFSFLLLAIYYL